MARQRRIAPSVEGAPAAKVVVASNEHRRLEVVVHPDGRALLAVATDAERAVGSLDAIDLHVDGRKVRALSRARLLPRRPSRSSATRPS